MARMYLNGVAAALAGGMQGYMARKRMDQDEADRADEKGWRDEQRQRQRMAWNKQDTMERNLAADAAPRTVEPAMAKPDTADNIDVGTPGTELTQTGQRVGSRTFSDATEAQRFAEKENAPQAVMNRSARTMRMGGDPRGAAQLESQALQAEAANMQVGEAKRKIEMDKGLQEVGSLLMSGGWSNVPEIYKRYGDGFDAQVIPDGKGQGATVVRMKDGKEVSRMQFSGVDQLFSTVAARFDPKLWADDARDRSKSAQAQANADRQFGLQERSADRQERNDSARLGLERERANIARGAGGGRPTEADVRDGMKSIASTLNADYKGMIDNAGPNDDLSKIKGGREAEVNAVQRLYQGAVQSGMYLTPEQAIYIHRNGKPGTVTQNGVQVPVVEINGRYIPMASEIGAQRPPLPASGGPAAYTGRMAAGGPQRPVQQAAPQQDPVAVRQQKIAEIQAAITRDNALKEGGISGIGARMIQQRAMPLGLAERRSLEQQLQALSGAQ
jgi:DNA-binding TFAR19-related protein (PDSD5 family)